MLPVNAANWRNAEGSVFSFETTIEDVVTTGEFRKFVVNLDFDPANRGAGKLQVSVDLRAADLGDPDMNAVLFDPAWFDIVQFTEAVFESADLTQTVPGEFLAVGTLSLKGSNKSVAVPFSWTDSGDKATMRGELILKRTDFDVGSGEWASDDSISVDVRLSFAVELKRGQ